MNSAYPHTNRVRLMLVATLAKSHDMTAVDASVRLTLPAWSPTGQRLADVAITPSFSSEAALEQFCSDNMSKFDDMDSAMRELGVVPRPFWNQ